MPEKPKPLLPIRHRLLLLFSRWKSRLLLSSFLLRMGDMGEETSREVAAKLGTLRWVTVVIGVGNLGLVFLGAYMMVGMIFGCAGEVRFPFAVVSLVAGIRLLCTIGAGFAQVATAATIVSYPTECSAAADAVARHGRRVRYRRWLWWTRFGIGVTILQFVGALYLTFVIVKDFSYDGKSKECFLGWNIETRGRKWISMVLFVVIAWLVVIIQCFTGSDVLRWRSFYSTHDTAWKAHYLEVFDHGIREALCCLGRVKYLSVLEEDEVSSVARLLGDLVAYRASGTGHLEFLAGFALLQRHKESPHLYDEVVEAPHERIREAAAFHQFAEAAYTGPLLDFGRNPLLFPCAWLYRQGILTPWNRTRRPVLQGDNWWRGHAAAFLKYVSLPPVALRKGRVSQTKREAAYFVMVLHHLQSVVIAVRGTETPEDLLTDVLCGECALTEDDLDGLINSRHLCPEVREKVISSFPHYGHSGIIESARELFMQIDGLPEVKDGHASGSTGFLSSLLGAGQECHGYRICIVGHSLGGSVATLLGLRLFRRYPNLHVYSYGTLPCVDSIVAEACSDFVTSIVYNDEFSARLSVTSIIRLRAAALAALSDDSSADSAMISKLARRLLNVNNHQEIKEISNSGCTVDSSTMKVEESNNVHRRNIKHAMKGGGFLCSHAVTCVVNMPAHCRCLHTKADCLKVSAGSVPEAEGVSRIRSPKHSVAVDESVHKYQSQEETFLISCSNLSNEENSSVNGRDISEDRATSKNFEGTSDVNLCENSSIGFPNNMSSSVDISVGDPPEMFLPGLVIHIVPEERTILPLWKSWRTKDKKQIYRAFVANREHFKDIIVTPYMFLDHLPWRCNYAMQRVLETWRAQGQLADNLPNGMHAV